MYSNEKPAQPERLERWRVTVRLTTGSPLHVGDGDWRPLIPELMDPTNKRGSTGKAATVFRNASGAPLIPATSLKGSLLAWARAHGVPSGVTDRIFGALTAGSGIVFHDATLDTAPVPKAGLAGWEEARSTAVMPHVVIDPVTRTADEGLLYFVEYVPPGAVFTFNITGLGVPPPDRAMLVWILGHAFSSTHRPARLGAEVAGGWGVVSCAISSVSTLDVDAWLSGPPCPWHQALTPLKEAARNTWLALPAETQVPALNASGAVTLKVRLQFQGALLVNDPSRSKKADSNGKGSVSHAMLRDTAGKPVLPSSSVRGVLRAQARRIWQTIAWDTRQNLNAKGLPISAPRKGTQVHLAAFSKVFGETGWRSPIEIEDFHLEGAEKKHNQEFVAIDRFTGGASDQRKFNAHGLLKPVFTGTIRLRPDRWEAAKAGGWAWLLLAWTLRDWIEGDASAGFGASKGWGAFKASVKVQSGNSTAAADLLAGILARDVAALENPLLQQWETSLSNILPKTEVRP